MGPYREGDLRAVVRASGRWWEVQVISYTSRRRDRAGRKRVVSPIGIRRPIRSRADVQCVREEMVDMGERRSDHLRKVGADTRKNGEPKDLSRRGIAPAGRGLQKGAAISPTRMGGPERGPPHLRGCDADMVHLGKRRKIQLWTVDSDTGQGWALQDLSHRAAHAVGGRV